jgi:hypothetical protein
MMKEVNTVFSASTMADAGVADRATTAAAASRASAVVRMQPIFKGGGAACDAV